MAGFIFGEGTDVKDPQELARRRAIIDAMMAQGQRAPQNVGEGIYSAASSITDALVDKRLRGKEDAARKEAGGALPSIVAMLNGGQQASPFGGASAPPVSSQALPRTPDSAGGIADDTMRALGREPMGPYRDAIASIESAGSGDYSAVGPTNERLGRALGRYQVMEANIGPWSREVLGREVSADEFLANPQLQDAIFDGKFGGYVDQFGPEGAAQAWFAGPGGVGKTDRKDVLGTSVGDYTQKFSAALGGGGQPAQGGAPAGNTQQAFNPEIINQLAALSSNPYASEGQRQIASMLMQQQMTQMLPQDPMKALELERAQLENERLRNPQPDMTATQREYDQAVQQGFQGSIVDYKTALAQAGRSQQNVNVGAGENAFDKKTGEVLATEANDVVTQAMQAQRSLGQISTLESALQRAPSGALGSMTNMAANLGIKTEGASDIELANSIISQLVPQQRPPGSGVMSDADLELFKQSLPRLINTREGNQQIVNTMRAIAEYDIKRGQIARQLQLGAINPQQAFDAYAALGNPVEAFKSGGGAEAPANDVPTYNPQTGQWE